MEFATLILNFAQVQVKQNFIPDWGMLGAVGTVVFGIVSIIITVIQIRRKGIKCVKISSAPLVQIDDRFADDLEVFFQGKKIQDVTSVILRVLNSGNQAITKADFEDSILFMFGQNTEIIKAEILKTEPTSIKANIFTEKNSIELKPLLLNRGDSIEISAVVGSFDGNIQIGGRIKDIKNITFEENESFKYNEFFTVYDTVSFVLIAFIMSLFSHFAVSILCTLFIIHIFNKSYKRL